MRMDIRDGKIVNIGQTTKKTSKTIADIRIKREDDQDGDLSYLGKFSDDEGAGLTIIARGEYEGQFTSDVNSEDWPSRGGRTYRFFIAESDEREYALKDYERANRYGDQWAFVGVIAEAVIVINGTRQTITSNGLWGVESDSDEEYFTSIGREELNALTEQLRALGFSQRSIKEAIAECDPLRRV